jgi:coenzyme F420-dependent glucose-6-phosphate dehydrogenase
MLKLGYKASAEQFAPRQLLDFAVHAEAVGFDSIMVSDHFQPWRHTGGHGPFSFAWLGALGERTSRAIIGTSVVTPTFRYHPAIVAQAVGTLGSLYPGRVLLGVGTGEALNEVPATGMPWPAFKERLGRLRESIELMRRLAREERVTFEGQYYRTERATIYDRPEVPVPIYVAASGPTAARLAGRLGDGFICTSGKARELYTDTLLPAVAEGLGQAGRAPDSIERIIEMKVSFDSDPERALQDTRHWAALALSPEEKTGVEDPVEMEKLADALPIERAASRWIVSSDPDEHVERLAETIGLGFTHLMFHAPGPDQRHFLDLYAEQVLPRLRARYGGTA